MEKVCSKCDTRKALTEFFRDAASRDGRHTRCKSCQKKATQRWRIENAEHYKTTDSARKVQWRLANKERYHAHAKKWTDSNPEKVAAIHQAYRANNKAAIAARNAKWQAENRERRNATRRISREKHREKEAAYARAWNAAHPDRVNANNRRRKAAKCQAVPAWANEFFVGEAYHLARLRTKATGFKWEVDHVVPLRSALVCGLHCEANLQVVPCTVNRRKSNVHWPDMP